MLVCAVVLCEQSGQCAHIARKGKFQLFLVITFYYTQVKCIGVLFIGVVWQALGTLKTTDGGF